MADWVSLRAIELSCKKSEYNIKRIDEHEIKYIRAADVHIETAKTSLFIARHTTELYFLVIQLKRRSNSSTWHVKHWQLSFKNYRQRRQNADGMQNCSRAPYDLPCQDCLVWDNTRNRNHDSRMFSSSYYEKTSFGCNVEPFAFWFALRLLLFPLRHTVAAGFIVFVSSSRCVRFEMFEIRDSGLLGTGKFGWRLTGDVMTWRRRQTSYSVFDS